MAEISDYEIRQINESIRNFTAKYEKLSKRLSSDSYANTFYKAQEQLKIYSSQEEKAIKYAEKAIDKAYNGYGFLFSREGFNTILSKKGEECSQVISNILTEYSENIDGIIQSLPSIDNYRIRVKFYEASEYSGDKEYSEFADFNLTKDSQVGSFGVGIVNTEYEHQQKNEETSYKSIPEEAITITPNTVSDIYETSPTQQVLGIGSVSNVTVRKFICHSISEIQANAFKSVNGLEIIVISDSIRSININAFRGIDNNCIIAFRGAKESVLNILPSIDCLNNRRVIFAYQDGDENLNKAEPFSTPQVTKPKRVIIKANTPLDNNEIKEVFVSRNSNYGISLEELNKGIELANDNINKDLILFETLKIKRIRDLNDNSYWNYANTLQGIIKYSTNLGLTEEALAAIFGLFFLDSSGYRMVNGKYNPYKQEPTSMYYHPKMQLNDLCQIQNKVHYSTDELKTKYKSSPYVCELNQKITDAYYSIDDSIQLMLMALDKPEYPFYPAQSGIVRKH